MVNIEFESELLLHIEIMKTNKSVTIIEILGVGTVLLEKVLPFDDTFTSPESSKCSKGI